MRTILCTDDNDILYYDNQWIYSSDILRLAIHIITVTS